MNILKLNEEFPDNEGSKSHLRAIRKRSSRVKKM